MSSATVSAENIGSHPDYVKLPTAFSENSLVGDILRWSDHADLYKIERVEKVNGVFFYDLQSLSSGRLFKERSYYETYKIEQFRKKKEPFEDSELSEIFV